MTDIKELVRRVRAGGYNDEILNEAADLIERLMDMGDVQFKRVRELVFQVDELEARIAELEAGLERIANEWEAYATPPVDRARALLTKATP